MRIIDKSAPTLARIAMDVWSKAFPNGSDAERRLFALVVVKNYFRTDFARVVEALGRWAEFRKVVGLTRLPSPIALERDEKRLLRKSVTMPYWKLTAIAA